MRPESLLIAGGHPTRWSGQGSVPRPGREQAMRSPLSRRERHVALRRRPPISGHHRPSAPTRRSHGSLLNRAGVAVSESQVAGIERWRPLRHTDSTAPDTHCVSARQPAPLRGLTAPMFAAVSKLLPVVPERRAPCALGRYGGLCHGCHPEAVLCRRALSSAYIGWLPFTGFRGSRSPCIQPAQGALP
jgi:hypothetical protein